MRKRFSEMGAFNVNKRDRIAAMVIAGIGLLILAESSRLPWGGLNQPGAGFMPFAVGVGLIGLALAYLIIAWPHRAESGAAWGWDQWKRPLLAVAGVLSYGYLLGRLGFLVTTLLFMGYWLWALESENWRKVLVVSVVATAGLYLIFIFGLRIALPTGSLFRMGG